MSSQARDRSYSRSRQPKSLESLYNTIHNACMNLQNALDRICLQCGSLNIDTKDEHVPEVLGRLDAFENVVDLAILSDSQCELLAEDLDLNLSEGIVIDIIKRLRDIELLRKNASTFFKTLNRRFSSILGDGVFLYCVSLIEITHEEVEEVIRYDEYISNQKLEISQAVEEICHMEKRWGNLTLDLHSTVDNVDGLQDCLIDIQTQWNEAKNKIFEWIKQDREYPIQLISRINNNKDSIQCLLMEMDAIDKTEKRRAEECRYRQAQIESLQKKRRELYNKLGHIQRAKRYNASKLTAYDPESAQGYDSSKKLDSKKNSSSLKSQEVFHKRRNARLDMEQNDVKESLASVDKKINELKQLNEEDVDQKFTAMRRADIRIEITVMEKISADCRAILLQRGKVQTFIQLRKGAIKKPENDGDSFEEACRFVARRVRHEWPRLYLYLPMWPIRSQEQRLEDISGLLGYERMNVVLPRNRTSFEDAAAALAKWRLLSRRYISVEGLVNGLRKAGWSKLANEVRKRFEQGIPPEEKYSEKDGKEIILESEKVAEDYKIVENTKDQSVETNEELYREVPVDGGEEIDGENEIQVTKQESLGLLEDVDSEVDFRTSEADDENKRRKPEEDNQNKSSERLSRVYSSNTNSVKEEEEQKALNQEGLRETFLAEDSEKLEEVDNINNSKRSKEYNYSTSDSSASSSRRSSMNVRISENKDEGNLEIESKSKDFRKDVTSGSSLNDSEDVGGNEELNSPKSFQESSKMCTKMGLIEHNKEDLEKENSKENLDCESPEGKNDLKSISAIEDSKAEGAGVPIVPDSQAKSLKEVANKSITKRDVDDAIEHKESVECKVTTIHEEPVNSSKAPEHEKPSNGSDKKRMPKTTISKTAGCKSRTKSNENSEKEGKPERGKSSKVHSDKKDIKHESVDESEIEEAPTVLRRTDQDEIVAEKNEFVGESLKSVSDIEEPLPGAADKMKKVNGKKLKDLDERKEEMNQNKDDLSQNKLESKESDTKHEVLNPEPEDKKAINSPSDAKLKAKSKRDKEDKKAAAKTLKIKKGLKTNKK